MTLVPWVCQIAFKRDCKSQKKIFAGLRPAPRWGLLAPRPPSYERPLATTPQKAELPLSADPGTKRVRSKKSAM